MLFYMVLNIGAESSWSVNGIIAIFLALNLESAGVYFRKKFTDSLLHCYQNSVELKLESIDETE